MTSETISVSLGARAYQVIVGVNALGEGIHHMRALMKRARSFIVSDETVAFHHMPALQAALATAGIEADYLVLPPGEGTKNFAHLEQVCRAMLAARIERGDMVIALGGGVIGDLVGLASGLVRRGVDYVQIPTTLLAQVDSSVGGKTAINVPEGKNLVGLFHQPRLVIADTGLLTTLSERHMKAGYAEVVKYGLINDAAFFNWLSHEGAKLLKGDMAALTRAVAHSVRAKAKIVERDETETGDRALLNLGHTFGHALEAATGFSDRLLHGEGVAIGMKLAFELSVALGVCDGQTPQRVSNHLICMGLPVQISDITGPRPSTDELLLHMAQDKKVEAGKLTFIVARGIGEAFIAKDVDIALVRQVLEKASR